MPSRVVNYNKASEAGGEKTSMGGGGASKRKKRLSSPSKRLREELQDKEMIQDEEDIQGKTDEEEMAPLDYSDVMEVLDSFLSSATTYDKVDLLEQVVKRIRKSLPEKITSATKTTGGGSPAKKMLDELFCDEVSEEDN